MSRYPKGYRKGDAVMPEPGSINPADALRDAVRTMDDLSGVAPYMLGKADGPRTLHADYVVIRDANGRLTPVSVSAFLESVKTSCMLFDMPFAAIMAMRAAYDRAGGKLPMTAESVREALG
jgi:hypothetical protein